MKTLEVEEKMDKSKRWLKEESEKRGMSYIKYKSVAIGYLSIEEEYNKGPVSQNFINKLQQLWDTGATLMSLGHHECELCIDEGNYTKRALSSSEKILRDDKNKIEYMFPQMIFHYIEEHGYQPPEDFVIFVLSAPFVGVANE